MAGYEEISKVYVENPNASNQSQRNKFQLTEKYQKIIDELDDKFYENFYKAIIQIFPELKNGAEYGDWYSSTAGWFTALERVMGKEKVDAIYNELEWYDSDFLDGEIELRLDQWFYKTHQKKKNKVKTLTK